MYRLLIKTPSTTRLFGACLLSFMMLVAAVASSGFVAAVGRGSAPSNATTVGRAIKTADKGNASFKANSTSSALSPAVAVALSLTVNTDGDEPDLTLDGDCDTDAGTAGSQCTLRAAIQEANNNPGGDTINFSLPPNSIITLENPLDDINDDLVINGALSGVTVSGDDYYRVFNVLPAKTVSMSNLTIADGQANIGGGIYNLGDLTIRNCTFTGNNAVGPGAEGGAIDSEGGTLTLVNSTISCNTSDGDGGGLLNCGTSTALLVSVTITNNHADADDDAAGAGGGIAQVSTPPTKLTMHNTIVAGNFKGAGYTTADDIFVSPFGGGSILDTAVSSYNLIGDAATSGGLTDGVNENQVGVADAGLGPLGYNGGPTQTHHLLTGSPAIDKGKNFVTDENNDPVFTDQRGLFRPVDLADPDAAGGDASDIGAYELQGDTVQTGVPSFVVNTPDDHDDGECTDGDCTLREAIIAANCDSDLSTITFDIPGPGPHVIQLTDWLDDLETDMDIQGPTDEIVQVRGQGMYCPYNIFVVDSAIVSISNLTISNGADFDFGGGGILNLGFLDVNNCTFTDNAAFYGGAIDNELFLTVNNSTFKDNLADKGGALYNAGLLEMQNSTLTSNHSCDEGGGIDSEGFFLVIVNSTISGNSSDGDGGGLLHCGDTIGVLTNVTITNNRADDDSDAEGVGGGISNVSSNPLTLHNTIVAGNFNGEDPSTTRDDIDGPIDVASSYNLIGDGTGMTVVLTGAGNQVGTSLTPINPLLGPLQDNGGPTFTHALLVGSPALEAGTDMTSLDGGINDSQTDFDVLDASGIPNCVGFPIRIDDEQMLVTCYSGNTLSVIRGTNGTTAVAHLNGAGVNPTFDQRGNPFARKDDGPDVDTIKTVDIGALEAGTEVNDPPDAVADSLTSVAEDSGIRTIPIATLLANDSAGPPDESGQTLTLSVIASSEVGGTATNDATNVYFAPAADYNGPASFQYMITDNGTTNGSADPMSDAATVSFTITEVNDPPDAVNDSLTNVAEDSSVRTVPIASLLSNDSAGPPDESGQTLTFSLVGGSGVGGTVSSDATNVYFTPAADFNGPASFQYMLTDNGTTNGSPDPKSDTATVSFTITEVNDAPTAVSETIANAAEDSVDTIPFAILTANDSKGPANESGQTLIVKTVSNPVGGTVSILGGNVIFTPTANYNGPASFQYTVEDNGTTNGVAAPLTSGIATASFNVTEVNDAPTAVNDPLGNMAEDAPQRTIPFSVLTGNDSTGPANESGQTLIVKTVSNPVGITVSIVAGTVRFTPIPDYNGPASFRYTVEDNGTTNGVADPKTSATAIASFNITEVNDAPTAVNDTLSNVAEDSGQRTISFSTLTANDSKGPANESGQTLVVKTVSNPVGGTVSILGSNVLFTPTADYNGPASFDYTVEDNGTTNSVADPRTSGTATVSFTITTQADTPSVTNATTNANTQTTSGLVISRNPADGAEVTHFKITGITGGTLFKHDGTTQIHNGDFITFAEGNAGLKFTPGTANGSFTVQSSLSASDAGLGGGTATATITINPPGGVIKFSAANYSVAEGAGFRTITVERTGDTSRAATVDYASTDHSNPAEFIPCTAPGAGFASSRCDFTTAISTLRFAAGETSKTFNVLISQDNYVEGTETLELTLSNPTGGSELGVPSTAILAITDDATEGQTNPIDDASDFVRQQYHDVLNREPDAAGLAFWTDNIEKCNDPARRPAGQTVAQCIDKQRESTAIAFFMSPEFQMTGGFVYRLYKGSLTGVPNYDGGSPGRFPTFVEFIRDMSQVSEGILVNGQISGAVVEANRNRLAAEFVLRPEFVAKYAGLNNTLYVQELFNTTGITPTVGEKQALVDGLGNGTETRASVLRKVVDGTVVSSEGNVQFTTTYGQAFYDQEYRRVFVFMEYVGYLRRNPDAAGFVFWLGKLNQFNGDPFQAEMVRSFILSPEYRSRFGQP